MEIVFFYLVVKKLFLSASNTGPAALGTILNMLDKGNMFRQNQNQTVLKDLFANFEIFVFPHLATKAIVMRVCVGNEAKF